MGWAVRHTGIPVPAVRLRLLRCRAREVERRSPPIRERRGPKIFADRAAAGRAALAAPESRTPRARGRWRSALPTEGAQRGPEEMAAAEMALAAFPANGERRAGSVEA